MDTYDRARITEANVREQLAREAGIHPAPDDEQPPLWMELVGYAIAILRYIVAPALIGVLIACAIYLTIGWASTALADTSQPPLGDTAAYGNLLRYAEEHGIPVEQTTRSSNGDGTWRIGWTDYRAVYVATDIAPERRVCVLAHELAHMELGTREADAYYVGFRVCDDLGYSVAAASELRRLRAQENTGVTGAALSFADRIAAIAAG